MHSSLFAGVVQRFQPHLEAAPWASPRLPWRPNVDAAVVPAPAPADFVGRLTRHVHAPVQWRASMERCAADFPGAVFVEVGPGRVLANLMSRRWLSNARFATDDGGAPVTAVAAIARELGRG